MRNKFYYMFQNLNNPLKKKKLNPMIKYPLKVINFFIFVFVYFIFKIFKLKLISSSIEAIGHQILDLETYIQLENQNKYKLLISTNKNYIGNRYFFNNYQKKKINCITFQNKYLSSILNYQKKFSSISFNSFDYITNERGIAFKTLKRKFAEGEFYKINEKDAQYGSNFLRDYNIGLNDKIILIHSRDSAFKPYDKETFRNSSIETLKSSVEFLIKNNFKVIRIGHKGSLEVSFQDKIIDLTNNDLYDMDILSIYLSYKCYLYIGSCSGINALPAIFGKPLLTINRAPIDVSLEICSKGLSLPKLYKRNEKLLKFSEMINLSSQNTLNNHHRSDRFYSNRNINIIDNKDDEILDATKEILEKIKDNSFQEDELQRKFRNLLKNKYSGNALGSISSSFINKYKDLID